MNPNKNTNLTGLLIENMQIHVGNFRCGPISCSVTPKNWLAVVGPAGSGKSTFIKAIAGLRPYDAGSILWLGKQQDSPKDRRAMSSMGFQRDALLENEKALDCVAAVANREFAAKQLSLLGIIHDDQNKIVRSLSGGMRKRVGVARALAAAWERQLPFLLLDEPTAGLDPHTAQIVVQAVSSCLQATQGIAVIITHDVDYWVPHAETVLVLSNVASSPRTNDPSEQHAWVRFCGSPRELPTIAQHDDALAPYTPLS